MNQFFFPQMVHLLWDRENIIFVQIAIIHYDSANLISEHELIPLNMLFS